MNDWKAGALGVVGTVSTVALDRLNGWLALAAGTLTVALLARKAFLTFRADLRAWSRRRRGN